MILLRIGIAKSFVQGYISVYDAIWVSYMENLPYNTLRTALRAAAAADAERLALCSNQTAFNANRNSEYAAHRSGIFPNLNRQLMQCHLRVKSRRE